MAEPPKVAAAPPVVEPHDYCPRTGKLIPVWKLEARRAAIRKRNTPQQAARRARLRADREAAEAANAINPDELHALLASIPEPDPLDGALLVAATVSLIAWFETTGRRQTLMRPRRGAYVFVQRIWLLRRHQLGEDPSQADLAAQCNEQLKSRIEPLSRDGAGAMMRQLRKIEAECGPWCR